MNEILPLLAVVNEVGSNNQGQVIGVAHYIDRAPQYLVRFVTDKGPVREWYGREDLLIQVPPVENQPSDDTQVSAE